MAEVTKNYPTELWAEGRFIEYAANEGWSIWRGLTGHEPFDYVALTSDGLRRVEVKGGRHISKRQAAQVGISPGREPFDGNVFDLLFMATAWGDFVIPSDRVNGARRVAIGRAAFEGRSRQGPSKWMEFLVCPR
jgi:hypothetical protein